MPISTATYALLSARAYSDVRPEGEYSAGIQDASNRAPLPEGWDELPPPFQANGSGEGAEWAAAGFSARAFRNLATGEVIVAFEGTEPRLARFVVADWLYGMLPAFSRRH